MDNPSRKSSKTGVYNVTIITDTLTTSPGISHPIDLVPNLPQSRKGGYLAVDGQSYIMKIDEEGNTLFDSEIFGKRLDVVLEGEPDCDTDATRAITGNFILGSHFPPT